jgi:glucokinase
MTVIGMDLGGTKLATAVFDDAGNVRHHERVVLDGRRGADVAALVADRCAAARAHARALGLSEVDGLGVTVPGIYRAARGTVWAPNIPGWDDYPLRDELRAALGDSLPVVIDSDRAAYILGETWRGAAQGAHDAVFIAVGTGIGAGLLADGRVLRGASDIAGAVGWLALDRPFRDAYVSCGCFEHHASGPGLAKVARELIATDASYSGELRDVAADALSAHHVFAAHERGDPIAVRVIDDAIAFWGMAAANFVSLLNPEVVVFGGGVFGPAVRFLDRIRAEAQRWAQPIAVRETRFVASTLGGDAGLYGAGRLAVLALSAAGSAT